MSEKPLFIPLTGKYFEQFARGEKTEELRRHGPRWNDHTCRPGRDVVLSRGYGKACRLRGVITGYKRQHGSTFGSTYRAAILDVYGTLDIWIACIRIGIQEAEEVRGDE